MRSRAEQYEEDIAEESQGEDCQLLDSQMADYNRLRAKVSKKSATLTQQLERVGRNVIESCSSCVHILSLHDLQ